MTMPSQDLERRCNKCEVIKPLAQFYMRTNGRPHAECKPCYKKRIQKFRDGDRISHRRKYNAWNAPRKARIRTAVFEAYGGYRCACCGEQERKFLTLDHINNDGAADRMKIAGKRTASGWTTYLHLYSHNFPAGYQVLCMNCNFGKRMNNGVCPHKVRCND